MARKEEEKKKEISKLAVLKVNKYNSNMFSLLLIYVYYRIVKSLALSLSGLGVRLKKIK